MDVCALVIMLGYGGENSGDLSGVASAGCPAGPPFAERWPEEMVGGPTDGPVTVAVGRRPNEAGPPASPTPLAVATC